MRKSKHTPGPWRYGAYVIVGADNATVVECQFGNPMQVADARLIAAAPDLLEALKGQMEVSIMNMRRNGFDDRDIADCTAQARAAIAKAEAEGLR